MTAEGQCESAWWSMIELVRRAPMVSVSIVEDPVCGMRLDPDDAAAKTEHDGRVYYFCSATCHDAFVADPSGYL
jgi:YHS domain-containing protein